MAMKKFNKYLLSLIAIMSIALILQRNYYFPKNPHIPPNISRAEADLMLSKLKSLSEEDYYLLESYFEYRFLFCTPPVGMTIEDYQNNNIAKYKQGAKFSMVAYSETADDPEYEKKYGADETKYEIEYEKKDCNAIVGTPISLSKGMTVKQAINHHHNYLLPISGRCFTHPDDFDSPPSWANCYGS